MTEPKPDLGSSSPLLAETNPPLPLGLLMANGHVLCSKHISPWPRVGLACPAPSWHGEMPALLGCPGRARGMQQVLLSPIPRGSCPVLAGAAQDPNLGTPPCGTTSPATWTQRQGTELLSHSWHQARASAAPRLWGLPPRTRRVMQHPELQGRTCPRGSRSRQGKAAVSAPLAGRTRRFSGSRCAQEGSETVYSWKKKTLSVSKQEHGLWTI